MENLAKKKKQLGTDNAALRMENEAIKRKHGVLGKDKALKWKRETEVLKLKTENVSLGIENEDLKKRNEDLKRENMYLKMENKDPKGSKKDLRRGDKISLENHCRARPTQLQCYPSQCPALYLVIRAGKCRAARQALPADVVPLPGPLPPARYLDADGRQQDGAGRESDKAEVCRRLRLEHNSRWRPEVEDYIPVDSMTWVRLIDDDVDYTVIGTIGKF